MNTWESASFTAVQIKDRIDNGTFVVPPYQRGYVWNSKQTDQFVDTLKRGLPFGTILLYHDEANNKYQIIDGLQRCTTIFRFINEPAPFFNEDDIEEELPQMLAQLTEVVNYGTMIDDIRNNLVAWVHRYRSMDAVRDMQYYEFAFQFSSLFPTARGKEREVVELVQPTLKKFKDLCEHLCTIRIPAIVIKGDDDALAIELAIEEVVADKNVKTDFDIKDGGNPYHVYKLYGAERVGVANTQEKISAAFDYFKDNSDECSMTLGVVDKNVCGLKKNHGYSVKEVTTSSVVIVDPWNSEKDITVNKERLLNNSDNLSVVYAEFATE